MSKCKVDWGSGLTVTVEAEGLVVLDEEVREQVICAFLGLGYARGSIDKIIK